MKHLRPRRLLETDGQMRSSLPPVTLALIALLLACTPRVAPPTNATYSPQASPGKHRFTDQQVERFLELYPGLATFEDTKPDDILERLQIDVNRLRVFDTYIGDCLTVTTYDLSPSYSLVIDDNVCFGRRIRIAPRERESDELLGAPHS